MRQTACIVINPITVDGFALLFNCTTAVRASDSREALTSGLGVNDVFGLVRGGLLIDFL